MTLRMVPTPWFPAPGALAMKRTNWELWSTGLCPKPAVSKGIAMVYLVYPILRKIAVFIARFFDESGLTMTPKTTPSIRIYTTLISQCQMPCGFCDEFLPCFTISDGNIPRNNWTAIALEHSPHFRPPTHGRFCRSIGPRAIRIVPAATGDQRVTCIGVGQRSWIVNIYRSSIANFSL